MIRPIGSESEFRRLREMAARIARGPGPKPTQQQRPPAGQGAPAAARPADPAGESTRVNSPGPKAAAPAASSAGPDRRQPAKAEDQGQAPTTGDNDRLNEL